MRALATVLDLLQTHLGPDNHWQGLCSGNFFRNFPESTISEYRSDWKISWTDLGPAPWSGQCTLPGSLAAWIVGLLWLFHPLVCQDFKTKGSRFGVYSQVDLGFPMKWVDLRAILVWTDRSLGVLFLPICSPAGAWNGAECMTYYLWGKLWWSKAETVSTTETLISQVETGDQNLPEGP